MFKKVIDSREDKNNETEKILDEIKEELTPCDYCDIGCCDGCENAVEMTIEEMLKNGWTEVTDQEPANKKDCPLDNPEKINHQFTKEQVAKEFGISVADVEGMKKIRKDEDPNYCDDCDDGPCYDFG